MAILFLPTFSHAGSFIFAGESRESRITHPSGYTGTGGVLDVVVCIDATATDASDMEISVKNIVKEINSMTASTPNLFFGGIPGGDLDFESLALHELGHCTGLAHPNLGFDPGIVEGANREFTNTGDGANDEFSFDAGTDVVIGSSDDQRDDDQNLHWFTKDVNNPFLEPANPQAANYSRDLAELPSADGFAANADRDVGALLGFTDTEAVMQQGQGSNEEQRLLQADDVTTYRMGMTGLDEISGTADDYTINMVYGGIQSDTSSCDIVIKSSTSGFGSCSVSGNSLSATHLRITNATFTYNSDFNWYFNTILNSSCSVGDDTLTFLNVTHNDNRNHAACTSISYGPAYVIGVSGNVTATAPSITLGPGTTINGTFTAISSVP